MDAGEPRQLETTTLAHWYEEFVPRLAPFLYGILKDMSLVDEAIQATFTKALTHGGGVNSGAEKAWLFQVGYREAIQIRRRENLDLKHLSKIVPQAVATVPPLETLLKSEEVDALQDALHRLPETQLNVVRMRIYDGKSFQQIADELQIPLGTALTRMRMALHSLQHALRQNYDIEQ